jgi:hypothetical protein
MLHAQLIGEHPRREVVTLTDGSGQDEDADGNRLERRMRIEYVPNTMSHHGTLTPKPRSSSSK